MNATPTNNTAPKTEFIALMAMMMSLVALSIDGILPAIGLMQSTLPITAEQDVQLIISLLLLGMGIGQLLFGPLSDSYGRKPLVYVGYFVFLIATFICIYAPDYHWLLVGRFMQGFGLAAPRILSMAIIRDKYAGPKMAQIMSFIMMFFILVPMLAPLIGQGILLFASWPAIFGMMLVMGAISLLWFILRQPETLQDKHRKDFKVTVLIGALKEVCSNKISMGYTCAAGALSGSFIAYLGSSQPLLQEQYELAESFALYFGALALVFGFSSMFNGKYVVKKGMQYMIMRAFCGLFISSTYFAFYTWFYQGLPSLTALSLYFVVAFACIGVLFGNLNALAMEPLGHLAGMGSAIVGALSTFIAVSIAMVIGWLYNDTALPLVSSFAVTSLIAWLLAAWVEQQRGEAVAD